MLKNYFALINFDCPDFKRNIFDVYNVLTTMIKANIL